MGATLVAQVLSDWSWLPDRAFRVLVRMALTALDRPRGETPAATYFGGHELLALTLRSGSRGGTAKTVKREVREAVQICVSAGAVRRIGEARAGHNGTYRLTLDAPPGVDRAPRRAKQEGEIPPPVEGPITPPQEGSTTPPKGGEPTPPKEVIEEPRKELSQEGRGDLRTTVTAARARDAVMIQFSAVGEGGSGTPRCPRHPVARLNRGVCPLCRAQGRSDVAPHAGAR